MYTRKGRKERRKKQASYILFTLRSSGAFCERKLVASCQLPDALCSEAVSSFGAVVTDGITCGDIWALGGTWGHVKPIQTHQKRPDFN